MWLSQVLERNAQCFGDRIALQAEGRSLSWSALAVQARQRADGLADLGLRPGDRAGIAGHCRIETLEACFALALIGVVVVRLDPGLGEDAVAQVADATGLRAVLGEGAALERCGRLPVVTVDFDGDGYRALATRGRGRPLPNVGGDDLALVLYRGDGPDDRPRGVVLDHRALREQALSWLAVAAPGRDAVLAADCSAADGGLLTQLTFMAAGVTVAMPRSPRAAELLCAVQEFGVTHLWTTAAALPRFSDLTSARLREVAISVGPSDAPMLPALAPAGVRLRHVYDLAEAGGVVATAVPLAEAATGTGEIAAPDAHTGAGLLVGRTLPGKSVRIDGRADLLPGVPGEVCLLGGGMMRGYWADKPATDEVLRDGVLHTGVHGLLDRAGRLHLIPTTVTGDSPR